MIKFHALDTSKLAVVNLAGLSNETIIAGNAAGAALGSLGATALSALIISDNAFRTNLITAKSSPITKQIQETDKVRDRSFMEIWRTADAASKSSIAINAAAGQTLVTFLRPYHGVDKEPIMSETSTLNYLHVQYNAGMELQHAAATLQLATVFVNLFIANEQVSNLWNERALEIAEKSGPSPTSLRKNLETDYHNFCEVVVQTLNLQPSAVLENLFTVMNEIRIKYFKSLPVRLTDANTSVAPIDRQQYTGKPITPIPQVFVKTGDDDIRELRFSVDFTVTYRNNTDVGEAKVIVHGKGKYSGSYMSTFHISLVES
jgi:hypothetical protein